MATHALDGETGVVVDRDEIARVLSDLSYIQGHLESYVEVMRRVYPSLSVKAKGDIDSLDSARDKMLSWML